MKDKISLGNTKDLTKKRKRLQQEPRKAKEAVNQVKNKKGAPTNSLVDHCTEWRDKTKGARNHS